MPNAICLLRKKIEKLIDEHFPINELIQIPNDPFWCNFLVGKWAIYVLFSGQTIIYIGISHNLGSRLSEHFRNSEYGNMITSVGIIRLNYKDWWDGAAIEAWLINSYRPLYNKDNRYLHCTTIPSDFKLSEIISRLEKQKKVEKKVGIKQ